MLAKMLERVTAGRLQLISVIIHTTVVYASVPVAVRLMPLGDSITAGYMGDGMPYCCHASVSAAMPEDYSCCLGGGYRTVLGKMLVQVIYIYLCISVKRRTGKQRLWYFVLM